MSTADARARILERIIPLFAERGFSYEKRKRKDPNFNRQFSFVKTVALAPPASLATWTIEVDLVATHAGKHILPELSCCVFNHAVWELFGPSARAPSPFGDLPITFAFSPAGITRGEIQLPQINRDEDPEPSILAMFEIIDTLILPRCTRYSSLDQLLEGLAPLDGMRSRDIVNGCGYLDPREYLSAIGAAFLLGKLDLCEAIALRARADLGSIKPQPGSIIADLVQQLHTDLAEFYQANLVQHNMNPAPWLGDGQNSGQVRR